MEKSHTDQALSKLHELGAHQLQHLNGDLAQHLKGTYELLREWGNSEPVCLAGLFHAVYGTAGFPAALLSLDKRSDIAAVIGDEAEELVYLYGACDRDYTYSKLISHEEPNYRNRFTQESFSLPRLLLASFCELTLANELEIVLQSHKAREDCRAFFVPLFASFEGLVSPTAFEAYLTAFRIDASPPQRPCLSLRGSVRSISLSLVQKISHVKKTLWAKLDASKL
jgi:hypothetical protein